MGKNRVATLGDETSEAEEKQKKALKKAEKKAREEAENKVSSEKVEAKEEDNQIPEQPEQAHAEEKTEQTETPEVPKEAKKQKKEKFIKTKRRSVNYAENIMMVEKNRAYSLVEALEILRKFKKAKFDETIELHINTTEPGVSGTLKLPHGNGKEVRVAIASDEILAEVEKGKINFDILVASPSEMPKLAKVARVLGPRGLMPNPKNGTISENPEEAAKKFQGGQMNFKTENNLPLIHLTIGKTSFKDNELSDNIRTVVTTIKRSRIRNMTLKSTMSPGIRLSI